MPGPRIAPLPLPLAPADASRMARVVPATLQPPQLSLTTARSPRLWAFMVDSGMIGPTGLMDLRSLPPRLRETVLLRTCVANGCDYEFNLHVQTISERMGLGAAEIDDVRRPQPDPALWGPALTAAIALVDALVLRRTLDDAEFERARVHFDDATLIELTNLIGLYTGVAMMVALARPDFDRYRSATPALARVAS